MENSRRLKIAYYSINDPLDKRSWSGTTYYLGQTLQRYIGDVHFLGPVKIPWLLDKTLRGLQKLSRFLFQTEYIPKYSFLKNSYAAFILKRRMKGREYDFLIAPAAASELGCLHTSLPVIYFGDATYKLYSTYYKREFHNLNSFSRWEGNYLGSMALKKSNLVILSSQWAAESAINDYNVPADKVEIVLLGANIDIFPERDIIFKKKLNKTLSLLFLAVDWDRKGGAIAFNTLQQLCHQGVEAKLIVCGCTPPPQFAHPCMEVIPFLDKNEPEDYKRFVQLLSAVHFLLLPTRADCSLLVALESNAYGVAAITTAVGGVPDVVQNGVNGYCLSLEATGKEYAALIVKIFSDEQAYHQLIASSRARFEDELNWHEFAEHFQNILSKHKLLGIAKEKEVGEARA